MRLSLSTIDNNSSTGKHPQDGLPPRNSRRLVLGDDEDDDSDDDAPPPQQQVGRHRPPRASALPRRSSILKPRGGGNRRRSSARFLKFRDSKAGGSTQHSRKSLHNIYKESIRMNAENKINANNSWSLKLIENLDQFLTEEEEEDVVENRELENINRDQETNKRINFTKASCTLDASVKIYSYRVDDVYLSSYKVLANLHRSDGNKKNKRGQQETADGSGGTTTERRKPKNGGSTLEANLANINLNKLEAAPVVDPLFHKMSKTFDEGGAKGLLLANLSTGGPGGCSIVFDSAETNEVVEDESTEPNDEEKSEEESELNMATLLEKLESTLTDGQPIHSLPFVPQLQSLRDDFSQLEEEGFIGAEIPVTRSRRYAPEQEEEDEADRSIHQDALERSRASLGMSYAGEENAGDDDYGDSMPIADDDDYAGENEFAAYDDDDFDDYVATDQEAGTLKEEHLRDSLEWNDNETNDQTAAMLDAISSGNFLGQSEYEYLDSKALSQVPANAWAGAAHWRPTANNKASKAAKDTSDPQEAQQNKEKTTKRSRKAAKDKRVFVKLDETPDLTDLLRMPPKPRGRNRSNNPLQFSKTILAKHTSCDNLLPPDANLSVGVFSSLFLRPNAYVKSVDDGEGREGVAPGYDNRKSVAFDLSQVQACGGNWDDDASFGGGFDMGGDDDIDDGPGFDIPNDDPADYAVEGLEDVRKVEKISIAHATIAKKVDVKRLKQELWSEIEMRLHPIEDHEESKSDADEIEDDTQEAEQEEHEDASPAKAATASEAPLSFYDTVQEMERNKKQSDVSLPFYFICLLHTANEKGLYLESLGLNDLLIHKETPSP